MQYILELSGKTAFYTGQALQLIAERFPAGEHETKVICESLFEWRQGRYESAYQNVKTAYQICQEILGDEVKDTLDNLALLALVLQYQGKYEAAEEMNRRALASFD